MIKLLLTALTLLIMFDSPAWAQVKIDGKIVTSLGIEMDVLGSGRFTGSATSVLTGSIDPTASTSVTGVGTKFTTELIVGDRITVSAETRTVTVITSNTALTVDTAFTDTANDTSPDKLAAILVTRLSSGAIGPYVNDLGQVKVLDGSPSAPSYSFNINTASGLSYDNGNSRLVFSVNGTPVFYGFSSGLATGLTGTYFNFFASKASGGNVGLKSTAPFGWGSGDADGALDVVIKRVGAGQVSLSSDGSTTGTGIIGSAAIGLKQIYLDYTNTATVGAVTINKATMRVNIAAAGTSVVVTDSLVTAASHVLCVMSTNDATGRVTSVVPAAGSFTLRTVAVTAQTSFDCLVINAD